MKSVDIAALDLGVAGVTEAQEMIRRLRAEMPAPFYLVAVSRTSTPDTVGREFADAVSDVAHPTLDAAVRRFREIEPDGDWCLLLGCGGVTRATCPKALLLDTRIFDKATSN